MCTNYCLSGNSAIFILILPLSLSLPLSYTHTHKVLNNYWYFFILYFIIMGS